MTDLKKELKAAELQMLAANIRMAKIILPTLDAAAAIVDTDAAQVIAKLGDLKDKLPNPSDALTHVGHPIEAFKVLRQYLDTERERLKKLIALEEPT